MTQLQTKPWRNTNVFHTPEPLDDILGKDDKEREIRALKLAARVSEDLAMEDAQTIVRDFDAYCGIDQWKRDVVAITLAAVAVERLLNVQWDNTRLGLVHWINQMEEAGIDIDLILDRLNDMGFQRTFVEHILLPCAQAMAKNKGRKLNAQDSVDYLYGLWDERLKPGGKEKGEGKKS